MAKEALVDSEAKVLVVADLKICLEIYLEIYLERKVKGTYSTYKSWSYTANNVDHLNKGLTVIVPSGYYYRVRGYHAAKDGSKESTTTLTSGVLVK